MRKAVCHFIERVPLDIIHGGKIGSFGPKKLSKIKHSGFGDRVGGWVKIMALIL